MKSKQTIEQQIEQQRTHKEACVNGSPSWNRFQGYINALQWVLRD